MSSRVVPMIGPVASPGLHIMSLNIRRRRGALAWRPADRWTHRAPRLRALLASERPTLLGVQEALPSQVEVARDALGPAYRYLGHGRGDDGAGEGCPIVYDAERLRLLEWTQLALSDEPHVAGSRSWGNWLPRIVVRALFRDATTGAEFVVLNTHLDPFSSRSRVRSAEQIRRWVMRERVPIIVSGDLNSDPESATVAAMLETGALRDAWNAASSRLTPEWGTYGRYRTPRRGGRRIDMILVSDRVDVDGTGINGVPHGGGWASDHLPVQAVLRLSGERGSR